MLASSRLAGAGFDFQLPDRLNEVVFDAIRVQGSMG